MDPNLSLTVSLLGYWTVLTSAWPWVVKYTGNKQINTLRYTLRH